jgi:hypothetical protein
MPQPPAARIAAHEGETRFQIGITKAILRTFSNNLEDLIANSLTAGSY